MTWMPLHLPRSGCMQRQLGSDDASTLMMPWTMHSALTSEVEDMFKLLMVI